jgi:hypothetical protein
MGGIVALIFLNQYPANLHCLLSVKCLDLGYLGILHSQSIWIPTLSNLTDRQMIALRINRDEKYKIWVTVSSDFIPEPAQSTCSDDNANLPRKNAPRYCNNLATYKLAMLLID